MCGARTHQLGLVELGHVETVGKILMNGRDRELQQQLNFHPANEHTAQVDFHHECVAWTLETRTELLAFGGVSATGGVGTRFTVPRPTP